jgi:hypothetical protein
MNPLSAEAFFQTAFEGHATDSEFRLLALERYLGLLSLALVAAGLYVIVVCFVFLPFGTALDGLRGVAPRVSTLAFAVALAVTVLALDATAILALTQAIARSGREARGEFLKTLIRSTFPFGVGFLLFFQGCEPSRWDVAAGGDTPRRQRRTCFARQSEAAQAAAASDAEWLRRGMTKPRRI